MRNDLNNSALGNAVEQDEFDRDTVVVESSGYAAPEMTSLGASKNLIQGQNWQGYGDFAAGYYQ
jgi:hypothetical protein